jgi:hypothetical protein
LGTHAQNLVTEPNTIAEYGPEDLSPIAKPLAQKKLAKKVYRTVKKGPFLQPLQISALSITSFEAPPDQARHQGSH